MQIEMSWIESCDCVWKRLTKVTKEERRREEVMSFCCFLLFMFLSCFSSLFFPVEVVQEERVTFANCIHGKSVNFFPSDSSSEMFITNEWTARGIKQKGSNVSLSLFFTCKSSTTRDDLNSRENTLNSISFSRRQKKYRMTQEEV